jgi:hypothetical protein
VPQRIDTTEVIPTREVGSVHKETTLEHLIRTLPDFARGLTAVIVTAVGSGVCIIVIFSSNPDLKDLRTGAWTLFAALVGACAGFLYGRNQPKIEP